MLRLRVRLIYEEVNIGMNLMNLLHHVSMYV